MRPPLSYVNLYWSSSWQPHKAGWHRRESLESECDTPPLTLSPAQRWSERQDLLDEGGVSLRDAPQAWQLPVHLTHQSAAARRGRSG